MLLQSFDRMLCVTPARTFAAGLRMVQLIGENSWRESATDFDFLRSPEGLAEVAEYAQGIGPWLPQVVDYQ